MRPLNAPRNASLSDNSTQLEGGLEHWSAGTCGENIRRDLSVGIQLGKRLEKRKKKKKYIYIHIYLIICHQIYIYLVNRIIYIHINIRLFIYSLLYNISDVNYLYL